MEDFPNDEASKIKLHLLLYQLSEHLKDPPVVIDLYDWRDNLDHLMEEIEELSPYAYQSLRDLVDQALRIATEHVSDLDKDLAPRELQNSSMNYNKQLAFVMSEINRLKSL